MKEDLEEVMVVSEDLEVMEVTEDSEDSEDSEATDLDVKVASDLVLADKQFILKLSKMQKTKKRPKIQENLNFCFIFVEKLRLGVLCYCFRNFSSNEYQNFECKTLQIWITVKLGCNDQG